MNAINEILAPANWELTSPKDKLFSSDHVIDAYLKGKDDGLEQQQKLIIEKLVSNINKAGKNTTEILSFLKLYSFSSLRGKFTKEYNLVDVRPERGFYFTPRLDDRRRENPR